MIEDSIRTHPQFRGVLDASKQILRDQGIRGLYRGVGPVVSLIGTVTSELNFQMIKQGANSAVRFTSYTWLKGLAERRVKAGQKSLASYETFSIGAMSGIITVCKW